MIQIIFVFKKKKFLNFARRENVSKALKSARNGGF